MIEMKCKCEKEIPKWVGDTLPFCCQCYDGSVSIPYPKVMWCSCGGCGPCW